MIGSRRTWLHALVALLPIHCCIGFGSLPEDELEKEVINQFGDVKQLCSSFKYSPSNSAPRRLFLGSLIADDSFNVVRATALEGRGIFHAVVYVEANMTQARFPRKMRWNEGTLNLQLLKAVWNPTQVLMKEVYDLPDLPECGGGLDIENSQREHILHRWKHMGMQPADVGVIADADETFTRDFLLAAKYCEIPALKTGPSQSCKRPKIWASTLIFEGGPECITANRAWFHPDMVVGQCIDIIGDRSVHIPGKRVLRNGKPIPELCRSKSDAYEGAGMRADPKMHTKGIYPLFNAWDFRAHSAGPRPTMSGGYDWSLRHPAQPKGYTGYHFHNFFDDMSAVRRKYYTYGHSDKNTFSKTLGGLHQDLNVSAYCAMNRQHEKLLFKYDDLVGPTPVVFADPIGYRAMRTQRLHEMVKHDEMIYGYAGGPVLKVRPEIRVKEMYCARVK